jgi:hypothetical protein
MYDPMGLWAWDDDWVETFLALQLPGTASGNAAWQGFVDGAGDGVILAANQFTFEWFDALNQLAAETRMAGAEHGLGGAYAWSEGFAVLSREAAIAAATGGAANAATAGLAKAATSNTGWAFVLSVSLKLGELRLAPATLETIHVLATSSRAGYVVSSLVAGAKVPGSHSWITQRVTQYARQAVGLFDANPLRYLSAKQASDSARLAAHRGQRIDQLAKRLMQADNELLQYVNITKQGRPGADIISKNSHHWWDLTTPGQWGQHCRKYGPGGTRIPTE